MVSERSETTLRLCSTIRTVRSAATFLIKEEHLRVECQGGGDLERPLATIGQFDRRRLGIVEEADVIEQFPRPVVEALQGLLRAPEVERAAALALQGDADVLEHAQVGEDG